jgi:hypothetical protein
VICAADAFVHHFGQAAFGKLIRTGHYDRIFDENREKFERKWNVKWAPHKNAELEFKEHGNDGRRVSSPQRRRRTLRTRRERRKGEV